LVHAIKRLSSTVLVAFFLTATLFVPMTLEGAENVKIGSAAYLTDIAERFAELAHEKSGGRISISVLRDPVFEDEVGNISAVQNGGGMQATVVGINKLGISPSMGFISFPYMFPSLEKADAFFASAFISEVNSRLKTESAANGGAIIGIGWFTNDYRVLTNSLREVRSPSDLNGMIVRVPESRVMQDTFAAWGARAVQMSWAEVPDALRNGIVHGQENPYSIIVGAKLQETQKFLTPIRYNLWAGVILVNSKWFDALSEELKASVSEAGREAALWKSEKSKSESALFKEQLVADGVLITEPADGEREWKELAVALWDSLYEKSGGREWIERVSSHIMGD